MKYQSKANRHQVGGKCFRRLRALSILMLFPLVSSCVTASDGASDNWQVDSIASRCVMSIIGGAIVGGIVGAAAGRGQTGSTGAGAAVGAAAGGVLCAVMASLDAQDRERIRAAQLDAARTGEPKALAYAGSDGLNRSIYVRPSEPIKALSVSSTGNAERSTGVKSGQTAAEAAAASGERICRRIETSVEVQSKGQASVPTQMICRSPTGDWEPVSS